METLFDHDRRSVVKSPTELQAAMDDVHRAGTTATLICAPRSEASCPSALPAICAGLDT